MTTHRVGTITLSEDEYQEMRDSLRNTWLPAALHALRSEGVFMTDDIGRPADELLAHLIREGGVEVVHETYPPVAGLHLYCLTEGDLSPPEVHVLAEGWLDQHSPLWRANGGP